MSLSLLRRFIERFDAHAWKGSRDVKDVGHAMKRALEDLEAAEPVVREGVQAGAVTWSPKPDTTSYAAKIGPCEMRVSSDAAKAGTWSANVFFSLPSGAQAYEDVRAGGGAFENREAAMLRAEAYARRLIEAFDGKPV